MRKALWTTGTVFVVLAALLAAGEAVKRSCDRHFYDGYEADAPLGVVLESDSFVETHYRQTVSFMGAGDIRVPAMLALPLHDADVQPPYPCVLFVYGINQRKEFLDVIAPPFIEAGFAMATFDQYTRGDRKVKDLEGIDEVLAFRRRGALTVLETRRMVDLLQSRDDIDPDRIYLVGASYGAITGATAAAFDARLRAAVLVYGGGNLSLLLDSEAAGEEIGNFLPAVVRFGAWFLAPADPCRHIDRIAPRPVLMLNGKEDTLVPPEAAEALYEAARMPKEIRWYEGDHIGTDEDTLRAVLNDAVAWLKQQDAAVRQTE
jgi:fermentation-respiration switch protein FrsA (DUF1100 family)